MSELVKLARELLRRRNVEQSERYDRDLKASYAEVSFLDHYGKVPSINDIMADGRRLSFISTDDQGRTMRVVLANRWPVRIYARWLDVDNFIFARCGSINNCELLGFLPVGQVEEAPIEWFEKDGKRSDYSHNIAGPECLVQLPETFSFVEECQHDGNAIWSYATLGWECIGCGRHAIDSDERERIANLDSQLGDCDQVSADQEGS
jgi:hypothetical protein